MSNIFVRFGDNGDCVADVIERAIEAKCTVGSIIVSPEFIDSYGRPTRGQHEAIMKKLVAIEIAYGVPAYLAPELRGIVCYASKEE